MLYTIIEISNLINLSNVNIYEKLKLKELEQLEGHTSKKKDITYIDDIGFNLIKDCFKQEKLHKFTNEMKITQDENIDYMVIIEILIEQLKEKKE